MSDSPFVGKRFNIITRRGSPVEARTLSGHLVKKEDFVFFKVPKDAEMAGLKADQWTTIRCADYHGEHFVYIDPMFNSDKGIGHWFAMCTCGSPAVIVQPAEAALEITGYNQALLVCYTYHLTLTRDGVGRHTTTGRKWA